MPTFEAVLADGSIEVIEGADTYDMEGPMTTFFATGDGRDVIDCWSTRVASVRTADVKLIRRTEAQVVAVAA